MENRIPIDQLFHDKLAEGRERLNLGAWANMERMLDGKNPYINDEKQKRRGLWPLFLTLLIATGVLGTGYLIRQSASHHAFDVRTKTSDKPQNRPVVEHIASSHLSHDETEVSNIVRPQESDINPVSVALVSSSTSRTSSLSEPNRNKSQGRADHITESTSSMNSSQRASNQALSPNGVDKATVSEPAVAHNATTRQKRKALKANEASSALAQHTPHSAGTTNNNESFSSNIQSASEPAITQMPVVSLKQSEVRDRSGKLISTIEDTIGMGMIETVADAPISSSITASLSHTESNPRFKDLSAEEDAKASMRLSEMPSSQHKLDDPSVATDVTASTVQHVASAQSIKKSSQKQQQGYFDELRNFGVQTYQRITNYFQSRPKPDWYNGVSMGMNMSLSNSTHNFGGFHAGFANLIPVSDYFSVVSEFKFFYRNNGGYTVNDIAYRILNPTVDNVTLPHQVIYGYQKDSTVRTYNFRNFYSLELPVMMQLNYRSLALYGGVNLAYNFKLKTTEKSRNYVVNVTDTVSNALAYSYPAEKASIVERSDFGPRLGLGYTVGASYNFNPQIYLDIRLTQNVLDNMRTNAARDISNGFFKVPTMQLSFGYRFRKFSPDN